MTSSLQLVPQLFAMHQAQAFANSFNGSNTYYVFAGRSYSWNGGDSNVAAPTDSVNDLRFNDYQDMIFGKVVSNADVMIMAHRNDWVSNTVYLPYDSDNDTAEDMGGIDGESLESDFYVGVDTGSSYDVFKCLDNAGGNPSTAVPTKADTSESDNFYQTSDGYRWKYMFSVDSATMDKFATTKFIPIVLNANVVANAIPGSIDVIRVTYAGNGYVNYTNGTFNSLSEIKVLGNPLIYKLNSTATSVNSIYDGCYLYINSAGPAKGQYSEVTRYYSNSSGKFVELSSALTISPSVNDTYEISPKVLIYGDGNQSINAIARALVTGSAISGIEMIGSNPGGKGYGFASANIYTSFTINPSYVATIQPVISPYEGHGGNPYEELFGTAVTVSVKFANSESNTINTDAKFRSIGLIRNPFFANVSIDVNSIVNFDIGEKVVQDDVYAAGYVVSKNATSLFLSNVVGKFVTGNSTYALITGQTNQNTCFVNNKILITGVQKGFETFDATYKYTGTFGGAFTNSELVYQISPDISNAYYLSSNSSTMVVTNKLGTFLGANTIRGSNSGSSFLINNTNYEQKPDISAGSGDILYIENFEPITRSNTLTETVKLVIHFS